MGDPESVAGLPGRVRKTLVELAADVLGDLDEGSTPPALARIRLFAPARRAASGAGPLSAALERDAAFRSRVATAWRGREPELAGRVDEGGAALVEGRTGQGDAAGVLAGLFLVRPEGWEDAAVALAGEVARDDDERARRQGEESASARVRALERELERLRADASAARASAADATDELGAARREIRRLRAEADRARAAARAAEQTAQGERQQAADEVARARAEAERERELAVAARERAEQAQRAGREGRSLDQARLRLLLDTVVEAATGLRRELALPPVGVRPADLVAADGGDRAGEGPRDGGATGGPARGQAADDPGLLAELLALPQVHLLVDGYNVTKSAYPALPLSEQRRRLVEGLAALVARTGAETTCVFDGADVEAPSALRRRGVRVLFSEPGTSADELVRRLVRAEPPGRPVVVVSSDNEVAAGVRASGARPVPAAALVRLLGRA